MRMIDADELLRKISKTGHALNTETVIEEIENARTVPEEDVLFAKELRENVRLVAIPQGLTITGIQGMFGSYLFFMANGLPSMLYTPPQRAHEERQSINLV